jgi:hypothetical protein
MPSPGGQISGMASYENCCGLIGWGDVWHRFLGAGPEDETRSCCRSLSLSGAERATPESDLLAAPTITNASQTTSSVRLGLMIWPRPYSVRSSDAGFGFGVGCPFLVPLFVSCLEVGWGGLSRGRIRLLVTRA